MANKTILVIDDETAILDFLAYNLEKEGYRVVLAETGEKGLELTLTSRPDLILLDLMLPQIDGLEVCRILKRNPQTRFIPVIILTAKSSEVDQVVGLEMGASDYLNKPFSVKVLLARIKNILKEKSQPDEAKESSVIQSGDFLLDRDRVRFSIKGKPIDLTKTEFGIMDLLMKRPGIVISRSQLVSSVWGSGLIVSNVSINMQIKSLRNKLGKYGDHIETVRGLGYRLTIE